MARKSKRAAQLDRDIEEALARRARSKVRRKSRHSHAVRASPHEQLAALVAQDSADARHIARDLLLKHHVIHSGQVAEVHYLSAKEGDRYVDEVRLEDDPVVYWTSLRDSLRVGAPVDFMIVDRASPGMLRREDERRPQKQLVPIDVMTDSSFSSPVAMQTWVKKWWS